jgi:hypothetical protein
VTLLMFDPAHLERLRLGIGAALDDLHLVRCDDPLGAEAMRAVRAASQTLEDVCLARVLAVLASPAMTATPKTGPYGGDVAAAPGYASPHLYWHTITDPLPIADRHAPTVRTFDEVLEDIQSKAMMPMDAPLDAHGKAGSHYGSLSFAPQAMTVVGTANLDSNVNKAMAFLADGMSAGLRQHKDVTIYEGVVRVTAAAHVLEAYDKDEGPSVVGQATEATVSGYMVIISNSTNIEISAGIGPDSQDPTQSAAVLSESSSGYTAVFYPTEVPDFEPVPAGPRRKAADTWTVTSSASPMVDGWGTWRP